MSPTQQSQSPTPPDLSTLASEGRSSANHRMIKLSRRRRNISKLFLPMVFCLYIISHRLPLTVLDDGKHSGIRGTNIQSIGSSFITVASASPIPEPSPARSKHSAHRFPPINGSIFGKRSLNSMVNTLDSTSSNRLLKLEERVLKKYQTRRFTDRTHPSNYQDIITELIEDFMALNNESNPEEATTSFCRMIVYECQQMLGSKSRSSVNENNKNYRV